jgi:hypothetical protein
MTRGGSSGCPRACPKPAPAASTTYLLYCRAMVEASLPPFRGHWFSPSGFKLYCLATGTASAHTASAHLRVHCSSYRVCSCCHRDWQQRPGFQVGHCGGDPHGRRPGRGAGCGFPAQVKETGIGSCACACGLGGGAWGGALLLQVTQKYPPPPPPPPPLALKFPSLQLEVHRVLS